MVIPITGDLQPLNPIRPKRTRSRNESEGGFEELLVDRVEAVDEGEQGSEERRPYREMMSQPGHGAADTEGRAAARESKSGEAEGPDSYRGRKIDLRA
ncbi:MAG: hypothetical protein JXQ83_14785 [Candidatus Glassbacteria bacterium]|nr:hypothetical protein [Candidatus Glassbacteria bacterium]